MTKSDPGKSESFKKVVIRVLFFLFLVGFIYVGPDNNPDYPYYNLSYNEEIVDMRFEPAYSWLVLGGLKLGWSYLDFYKCIIVVEAIIITIIFRRCNWLWVFACLPTWIFVLPTFGVQIRFGLATLLAVLSIEIKKWWLKVLIAITAVLFHKSAIPLISLNIVCLFLVHAYSRSKTRFFWCLFILTLIVFLSIRNFESLVTVFGYTEYHGTSEFEGKSLISIIYLWVLAGGSIWFVVWEPAVLKSRECVFWLLCILASIVYRDFAVISGRFLIIAIFYETLLQGQTNRLPNHKIIRLSLLGVGISRIIASQATKLFGPI